MPLGCQEMFLVTGNREFWSSTVATFVTCKTAFLMTEIEALTNFKSDASSLNEKVKFFKGKLGTFPELSYRIF